MDFQQRCRQRFKNGFIAAVAVMVIVLVGLLIEGCMSEQSSPSTVGPKAAVTPMPSQGQVLVVAQKPDFGMRTDPNVTRQPAVPVVSQSTVPSSHSEGFYVVKSGDTLGRIAKAHGTTVKALKSANSLQNDRIVVGAKLKIPAA